MGIKNILEQQNARMDNFKNKYFYIYIYILLQGSYKYHIMSLYYY